VSNKDYPYAIRATDLMQNFVYATLDINDSLVEEQGGPNGHIQRRLNIDAGTAANQIYIWDGSKITVIVAPPTSGTYVLGATGGALSWIETEACD